MTARSTSGNTGKKKGISIFILLILLFDLVFLYFIKYSHKNMSIMEFNPRSSGNILNFIFFLIPAAGFLFQYFSPGRIDLKKLYGLLFISVMMNIPLLFTLFLKEVKFPLPVEYLFGYPFEKIYIAVLFVAFQFFQFLLAAAVWQHILKVNKYLYLRSFFYSFLVIIVLIAGAFIYTNEYVDRSDAYFKKGKKSDVAVILGAAVWSKNRPSPIFASRIGKANNLYNAGIVRKLLVTGGNAPGEMTEAEVAYKYLVRYGVDPDNIWIEKKTSSTSEQIEFIKENLVQKRGLKSIIIVSDQFHLKRAIEICHFYNVNADGVASDLKLSWEKLLFYRFRDSIALLLFWLFAL
ncbi:MAG: YdcF family protein [Ignavibacteriales bacterium]